MLSQSSSDSLHTFNAPSWIFYFISVSHVSVWWECEQKKLWLQLWKNRNLSSSLANDANVDETQFKLMQLAIFVQMHWSIKSVDFSELKLIANNSRKNRPKCAVLIAVPMSFDYADRVNKKKLAIFFKIANFSRYRPIEGCKQTHFMKIL